LRLLIVEDEPMIALYLAAILRGAGADVLGPAHSISHARKLLAKTKFDAAALRRLLRSWKSTPARRT